MTEKPKKKRLKRNISFSEHDKDIYDYLNTVGNASALIKRLVYNHMIMEKGLVAPVVVTTPLENSNPKVNQDTQENPKEPKDEPKDEKLDVKPPEPPKPPELTPEEIENMKLAQELDL